MNTYTYRHSTRDDEKKICELLKVCFGEFAIESGALSNIDGKYMMAEFDGELVAITGILPLERSSYNGYEITWTCTLPQHRKHGLICKMLSQCEKSLPDDGKPLYCECWRFDGNENPNLGSVMKHMGMRELVRTDWQWLAPHRKECNTCVYRKDTCRCYNDLYYKER